MLSGHGRSDGNGWLVYLEPGQQAGAWNTAALAAECVFKHDEGQGLGRTPGQGLEAGRPEKLAKDLYGQSQNLASRAEPTKNIDVYLCFCGS